MLLPRRFLERTDHALCGSGASLGHGMPLPAYKVLNAALAEWNSCLNSGYLKSQLSISWAEIFEDFQSIRTTSLSEKFKERIYRPAYSVLKGPLHFSRERPGERLFTRGSCLFTDCLITKARSLGLGCPSEHMNPTSLKQAPPLGSLCPQSLLSAGRGCVASEW